MQRISEWFRKRTKPETTITGAKAFAKYRTPTPATAVATPPPEVAETSAPPDVSPALAQAVAEAGGAEAPGHEQARREFPLHYRSAMDELRQHGQNPETWQVLSARELSVDEHGLAVAIDLVNDDGSFSVSLEVMVSRGRLVYVHKV